MYSCTPDFISENVSREYKVLKLDKKSQQSYRKREQAILEKELLSSLIDREINAQKNLDNSVERFRSLPPEVQEKILMQIGQNKKDSLCCLLLNGAQDET